MYNMSLIFNPDHQQVLEYHKDLIKKTKEIQLLRAGMMASTERPYSSLRKLLQLVMAGRHTNKMAPTINRTPRAQPKPQNRYG